MAITQTSTDDFVVGELLDFLHYAEMRPLADGGDDEDALAAELGEVKARLYDLDQRRYVRRTMQADRYEKLSKPLEAEVEQLEARLLALRRRREERVRSIPLGDREALGTWWEDASGSERIAAVRQAIRTVTVKRVGRSGGNRFDSGRVKIDWNWETFRLTEAGRALERFWTDGV